VLYTELLRIDRRQLQRLLRREESQRGIPLGDLAGPQVAVGAEADFAVAIGAAGGARLPRLLLEIGRLGIAGR
jgi:hypothetical protein